MANEATKDDLVGDCRDSFKVICDQLKYGSFDVDWLERLNRGQLTHLSTFLDEVWEEIRPK